MNYLAHAYLSFGDAEILAGNILSDFIKGKKKFEYPIRIQQGITLHRAIDEFTDNHSATAEAKEFFKPAYGLYSAAFIDIVYDHFLALDKTIFPDYALADFARETYRKLKLSQSFFPDRFRDVFPYMETHNWLYNYQFQEGIFRSFGGLVHRAKYMNDPKPACDIFKTNYIELGKIYQKFFPELLKFVSLSSPISRFP